MAARVRKIAALLLALAWVVLGAPAASAAVVTEHCAATIQANDDPIVHPGEPGAAHLHNFAGNPTVNAFSTPESLYAAGVTSCSDVPTDFSAYWTPAIYEDGVMLKPSQLAPYWQARPKDRPVVAPPFGMRFVARGWGEHVFFACTQGSANYTVPQDCTGRGELKFRVVFPTCWDGVGTDPSAFVYAPCPVGFTRIVGLLLQVNIPVVNGLGHTYTVAGLADGTQFDYTTMHADFMDAFDPVAMQGIVDRLNS